MVSGSRLLRLMAPMNFFWLRFWKDQAATPRCSKHSLTLTLNYRLSNMTAVIHYSKAGRKCMRSNLQRDQSHYGLMLLWQFEAKQTSALTPLLTQTKWTLTLSDLSSTIKPRWGHRGKKRWISIKYQQCPWAWINSEGWLVCLHLHDRVVVSSKMAIVGISEWATGSQMRVTLSLRTLLGISQLWLKDCRLL